MIERFVDGDGKLALSEIESRQRKHFALIDRNDDGVLQKDELRRAPMGDRHAARHHGGKHHGGKHRRDQR